MKKSNLNEIKRMQQLAGIVNEGKTPNPSDKGTIFSYIDGVLENPGYEVTDMESLKDEMEYSDLIDAVAEKIEGSAIGAASIDSYEKAKQALLQYGKEKFGSLPIEGELVGNTFMVDFDDLGNLWADKFREIYGHEYDDLNDEDNNNFETIQDEVVVDLENKLSAIHGRPIKLKWEY